MFFVNYGDDYLFEDNDICISTNRNEYKCETTVRVGNFDTKTMKQLINSFEIEDTLYKKNFKAKDLNNFFNEIPHKDSYNLMCDLLFLSTTKDGYKYLLVVMMIFEYDQV